MANRRVLDNIHVVPKTIDRNAVYMGNLNGSDNYLVHGQVFGDSDLRGTLMLSEDCQWKGNIVADVVVVKGEVNGDITAHSKIELRNTAKVTGLLSAPIVAIAHGASLEGEVDQESFVTHFEESRGH